MGGDHYDFIPLEDGRLAFAVADVSGKGTPASILMASVHASLRALAGASPPGALMTRLNRFLYESTQANKFVTLFFGELDPATRRVRFVNAGHVPPYLVRAEGRVERLEVGGPAVGLLEEAAFPEGEVQMAPGDTLAIVTDGATEALSPGRRGARRRRRVPGPPRGARRLRGGSAQRPCSPPSSAGRAPPVARTT